MGFASNGHTAALAAIRLGVLGLLGPLALSAHGQAYAPQGYWAHYLPASPYESFVRVYGDSGFYCILDGKSSFAFAIRKDSITTPMNGMNAIAWAPNSGDLVISGSEKGEPYRDRFKPSDSAAYWGKCRGEEQAWKTTALRPGGGGHAGLRRRTDMRPGLRAGFAWGRKTFSASGRAYPLP